MDGPITSSPPGDHLRGQTVLVIEDEPLIAFELANELKAAGAHVICTRSPQTACQAIDQHQLSAAVVDFRLGADGAQAAVARLRNRKVPFMFYTGLAIDGLTATAPVVNKPARAGLVVETLAQILAQS
jgi:DNA-binding response OmpR family regulator